MIEESVQSNIIIAQLLLAARLSRQIGNRLSMHGISVSEYVLLQYLAGGREISRIELAEYLSMSASGVTRMLQPLEKNGVVESVKNPRDSRQSLVKLTAAGLQLLQDASSSFTQKCQELTTAFTPAQLERYAELLQKIG